MSKHVYVVAEYIEYEGYFPPCFAFSNKKAADKFIRDCKRSLKKCPKINFDLDADDPKYIKQCEDEEKYMKAHKKIYKDLDGYGDIKLFKLEVNQ